MIRFRSSTPRRPSDKTYTDAQAAVTEQTANVKSLKASIDEYTQKLRELQNGAPTKTVDQVNTEIQAANDELNRLLTANAAAIAEHEANYKRLSTLAGGRDEVMAAYCNMSDEELAKALGSYTGGEIGKDGTVITPATANTEDARAVKAAYAALKDYYAAKSAQEERLTTLQAELEVAQKYTTTAQTIQQYQSKLNTATYDLNTAQNTLNNAQNIVNQYDNNLKALKASVDPGQEYPDGGARRPRPSCKTPPPPLKRSSPQNRLWKSCSSRSSSATRVISTCRPRRRTSKRKKRRWPS